jgi:DNA-directed RNA polymerase subunit RPC12/RpoP
MDNFIEMDFDDWCEQYKPIVNHIDNNASFDNGDGGLMFETYGDEVEFVKSQSPDKIWMYGDGDDGAGYLWSGWGFVNRIGYFITEVPCPPNTTIQVLVSHNWYYCENCGTEMEDPDNLIRDAFDEADLQKCPHCATLEEITQIKETQ